MILKVKAIKSKVFKSSKPLNEMKCIHKTDRLNKSQDSSNSVLFCRYIGMDNDLEKYLMTLKELDLCLRNDNANYIKVTEGLVKLTQPPKINEMKCLRDNYLKLEKDSHVNPQDYFDLDIGKKLNTDVLEWTKKKSLNYILKIYDESNPNTSKSARENFLIKILFWIDTYLPELYNTNYNDKTINKVLYYGDIKRHELYFLLFLNKMGCDVIYINPVKDINISYPEVKNFTNAYIGKSKLDTMPIFPYEEVKKEVKQNTSRQEKVNSTANIKLDRRKSITSTAKKINSSRNDKVEKSFEELALFAESVVMIKIYNNKKVAIGGGSGVVINGRGNIITNSHVVSGGAYFGIIFENDDTEYFTATVIKYHTDYDLALLKVDKESNHIELSNNDLVRGQKIFSIGSPLGLFNTISEGIVSGFRNFDNVEMIQISAPISPGSSGGALLDMYGNLVGITTAGFSGQNLNIVVPSKYIKQFAENFLK